MNHEEAKRFSIKEAAAFSNKFVSPAIAFLNHGNILDYKKMDVYVTPEVQTAATYFDHNVQKHVVFIGTSFDVFMNTSTDQDIEGLIKMLMMHEFGHVLFTDLDLEKINKLCQEGGIPFSFLNLMEDARIEHLIKKYYLQECGISHRLNREKWTEGCEEQIDMSPEETLFNIINTEDSKPIDCLVYDDVYSFYERIIKAKNTEEVVEIAIEWKDHFHDPKLTQDMSLLEQLKNGQGQGQQQQKGQGQGEPQKGEKGNEKGNGSGSGSGEEEKEESEATKSLKKAVEKLLGKLGDDLSDKGPKSLAEMDVAQEGQKGNGQQADLNAKNLKDMTESKDGGDQEKIERLKRNAVSPTSGENMREVDYPFAVDATEDLTVLDNASNTKSIFPKNGKPGEFNQKQMVEEIVPALQKIKAATLNKQTPTRKPTKRFNAKNLSRAPISMSSKIYKKQIETPLKIGKKSITAIIDLSGSMSGQPTRDARTLALALNRLAKQFPQMDITLIGCKVTSKSMYQAISLPSNEESILAMEANGSAEGIGYALTQIVKKTMDDTSYNLKKQDALIVITDGNMGSEDIKQMRKALDNDIGKDTKTIGVYVGNSGIFNKDMPSYFQVFINDTNLGVVTERIVEEINAPKSVNILSEKVSNSKNTSVKR